jgi:hypothetical protein
MVTTQYKNRKTFSLTFLSVDLKSKDNTPPWEGEVPMEIGM